MTCPDCGADLTRPGSVRYIEEYDAHAHRRDDNTNEVTVYYAGATIDSHAECIACGRWLDVYDQEMT